VLKIVREKNFWAVEALPEPRWGRSQRSPDLLAGGEGACCPLRPEEPTPLLAFEVRPRFSALRSWPMKNPWTVLTISVFVHSFTQHRSDLSPDPPNLRPYSSTEIRLLPIHLFIGVRSFVCQHTQKLLDRFPRNSVQMSHMSCGRNC